MGSIGKNWGRMPRASALPKGTAAAMDKRHYDQTPALSNVIAPRGFGYYDAFANDPKSAGTAFSVGPATAIVASSRVTAQAGVTTAWVTVVYPDRQTMTALSMEWDSQSGTLHAAPTTSPQLVSDPPHDAIATRCSVRMRNVAPVISQGGTVRTLRMTSGFDPGSYTTEADWEDFLNEIRNHARTRSISGANLVEDHQINCTVVDSMKAATFEGFSSLANNIDQVEHFKESLKHPTFTPIVILFEPIGGSAYAGNPYELTIRTQFLCHYTAGTMLANLAIQPKAIGDAINKHRDKEEGYGSQLLKAGHAVVQYAKDNISKEHLATAAAVGASMATKAIANKIGVPPGYLGPATFGSKPISIWLNSSAQDRPGRRLTAGARRNGNGNRAAQNRGNGGRGGRRARR